MWWAVATLTTVGYGDMTPITSLGKILGSISAIFGIGFFALPAGLLATGFSDEMEKEKNIVLIVERNCKFPCPTVEYYWNKPLTKIWNISQESGDFTLRLLLSHLLFDKGTKRNHKFRTSILPVNGETG